MTWDLTRLVQQQSAADASGLSALVLSGTSAHVSAAVMPSVALTAGVLKQMDQLVGFPSDRERETLAMYGLVHPADWARMAQSMTRGIPTTQGYAREVWPVDEEDEEASG